MGSQQTPRPPTTLSEADWRLIYLETPRTTRFLLSNGAIIDVESITTDSRVSRAVLDFANAHFDDKDLMIVGTALLQAGQVKGMMPQ